jgi:hypothetical protein
MIVIVLVIAAGGILLGLPAVVGLTERAAVRRAEARAEAQVARRQGEEERRQAKARAEEERRRAEEEMRRAQEETERRWRETPDLMVGAEFLKYQAVVQTALTLRVEDAQGDLDRLTQEHAERGASIRNGGDLGFVYRLLVFAGVGVWLAVTALAVALDFLIFRGLHPSGGALLPAGLAALAVIGVTVGSIMAFDARRHGLLPNDMTLYFRRVVMTGGVLLALGVAAYMVDIAPYRSAVSSQREITEAQHALDDVNATTPIDENARKSAGQALDLARENRAAAQRTDRLSAAALAAAEIPLSHVAVLGGALLLYNLSARRTISAEKVRDEAKRTLRLADDAFADDTATRLTAYGHGPEVIQAAIQRVRAAFGTPPPQRLPPGGGAGTPSSHPPPTPGGGNPPPPGGHPTVTIISPDGSPVPHTSGPPGMSPRALDETE